MQQRPPLNRKLFNLFYAQEAVMNQDIHVRDIIVYPDNIDLDSYGEHTHSPIYYNQYQDIHFLERLTDQVKIFAEMATLYHRKYYCDAITDGNYRIKENHLNTITRLSTHEFFLYTKTPLTESDLSIFINAIHAIAKKQEENVHLLLSSISVVTADKKILNLSLYVQCGKNAKVDPVNKARAFETKKNTDSNDPGYPDHGENFSQQALDDHVICSSPFVCSDIDIQTEKSICISSNSILFIETFGGAKCVLAIDICLDHVRAHSKNLLEKFLLTKPSKNPMLIPSNIEHIVTSNHTTIHEKSKISKFILHVDPRHKERNLRTNYDLVTQFDLEEIFESDKYDEMSAGRCMTGFAVNNPPFGKDYHFQVMRERKMDVFTGRMNNHIYDRNERVMENRVNAYIDQNKVEILCNDNQLRHHFQIFKRSNDIQVYKSSADVLETGHKKYKK